MITLSRSEQDFISNINRLGCDVNWSDTRKNITYTTPDGKKCRDNKLHDKKYLKEEMENEFRKIEANTLGKEDKQSRGGGGLCATDRKIEQPNKTDSATNSRPEKESIRERLAVEKAKIERSENEKRVSDLANSDNVVKRDNRLVNKGDILE